MSNIPEQSERPVGRVWLVGAGPGDAELLTLRAVRVLATADVILVDDLVSDDVLGHARAGARIVRVGKRGGCPSTPQAFIERLMIKEALAGNTVVRLKGGDPFVFGRGGEEMEALAAHGIEAGVVPGITAGIAAPARLGIPVTHRAVTHGVAVVTAHGKDHDGPHWAALVASGLTIVIYMGVARAAGIARSLQEAGMPADMPAAVIANASRSDERAVVCSLATLATTIDVHCIGSPAIIIVGRVIDHAVRRTVAGNGALMRSARV